MSEICTWFDAQTCIQTNQVLSFSRVEKTAHVYSGKTFWKKRERSAHAVVVLQAWRRASEERTYSGHTRVFEKPERSAHRAAGSRFWKRRGGAHIGDGFDNFGEKEQSFCDVRKRVREAGEGFIYASLVLASWCARPK